MNLDRAPSTARRRRGFWPLRDLPAPLWLAATVLVSLIHPWLASPRWLMLHLLLLGAVSHSILVWSRHFAETLLHLPNGNRAAERARLALHNAGVLAVLAGGLSGIWLLTLLGAVSVAAGVSWHAAGLVHGLRRALPSRFTVAVHHYVAAACLMPVGITLGVLLARGPADPWHTRLLLAHVTVQLLGWVGLTVVGTLLTLWPTMLRTRLPAGAELAAGRGLVLLTGSVLFAGTAALAGQRWLFALGLLGYLAGLGLNALAWWRAARGRPPAAFAPLSVGAAALWLAGCLVALVVGLARAGSWADAGAAVGWLVPFLAAGFGAQVLLGALSHLLPVVLGGGSSPVRAAEAVLNRGAVLRVVVANASLLVCALPVPSLVRVLAATAALIALGAVLPLLVLAIRASWRTQQVPLGARPASPHVPARFSTAGAGAGVAAVAVLVALGVALDPAALSLGPSAAAGAHATGHTTTVEVVARGMRFVPAEIEVPAGDRLVVVVTNDDPDVHDLALDSGARTRRLGPGESERLEVGVVGRDLDGWCTVAGHRQMGMVLRVVAVGAPEPLADGADGADGGTDDGGAGPATTPDAGSGHHQMHGATDPQAGDAADDLDFMAAPDAAFEARDATLGPLPPGRVHRLTLTVTEQVREVAPGVEQRLWTYNGTAPGPVLHGRVGDTFDVTLVNDGTIGHSVDFHAGSLAPDRPMRTIAPGESLRYRFTATRAGIWMYHCSTMPMTNHIANGMFGAVVIEPRGLPRVDRSYVLVQSELYLGPQGGEVDGAKVAAEEPDVVAFNGYADQYAHRPLPARVGERVRVWVLDAGPSRATSFHVVGGQFDTVWFEGDYLLDPRAGGDGGSQALALAPAQGGFVELEFPEAGHYPFVSHVMVDAERGARGMFEVTGGPSR